MNLKDIDMTSNGFPKMGSYFLLEAVLRKLDIVQYHTAPDLHLVIRWGNKYADRYIEEATDNGS